MKKQGYVIGQYKAASKFFTTTSAYDRPQWVDLKEASVFPTADMAQQAAKKLWKYGAYTANLISISEMYDDTEGELDSVVGEPSAYGADGDLEGDAIDAMDTSGDPDMEQEGPCPECGEDPCVCDDDGEPCPDCGEAPCVCGGDDESAYGADGELDGDAIPAMDGADDLESADGNVSMSFEMPNDNENDENAISPDEIAMLKKGRPRMESVTESILAELSKETLSSYIKKASKSSRDLINRGDVVKGVKRGKNVVWADAKVKERSDEGVAVKEVLIKDPATSNKKPDSDMTYATAHPHDDKVKVPAGIKSALKKVVDEHRAEAKSKDTVDDTRASFCLTVADALQTLHDDLSKGDVEGIKQAQIHMSSYMSPITQHIPSEVVTFITRGGRQSTLKNLFSSIKESKRMDYDTMADHHAKKKGQK